MFDLSFFKIAVLAVIALVVFGPDQLPRMAAQAGRALRDVRRLAENARADLQQHLPEELQDFDVADLNPKHFVRKHLLDEVNGFGASGADTAVASGTAGIAATVTAAPALLPGEHPPYDDEAT
ncbi:MAG TPA: sec-independent translocase [Streptosporangiaceae bacterium]